MLVKMLKCHQCMIQNIFVVNHGFSERENIHLHPDPFLLTADLCCSRFGEWTRSFILICTSIKM